MYKKFLLVFGKAGKIFNFVEHVLCKSLASFL